MERRVGNDRSVLIDGAYNQLKAKRASIPNLIGWDAAFLVKALRAMDHPDDEVQWMLDALEAREYHPSEEYGVPSMAHVVEVFAKEGRDAAAGDLHHRLVAEAASDGSFQNDEQVTAYALPALRAVDDPMVDLTESWLWSRVQPTGQIVVEGYEYFEVQSEVLYALLQQ